MARQNTDEQHPAVSFLRALYRLTPGGYVELRAIANDKFAGPKPRREFVTTPTQIIAFAEKYGQKDSPYGVYFGVNKREREDGTKKSIERICALYADVDTLKNGWDTEETIKRIHSMTGVMRPTACVRSGGGLHLYWFLKETDWCQSAVEGTNKALRDVFAGDAVQNVDRILRLPGTWNTKRRPVKRVEVAWCYEFDRVDIDDVAEATLDTRMWLDTNGTWGHRGAVTRNSKPDPVDPLQKFEDMMLGGKRGMSKNMAEMWVNGVRYHAPRGYLGIHEAALLHTAHLHICSKATPENVIVKAVMDNIRMIKDRDAPHEDWDMSKEEAAVLGMLRSWKPKWQDLESEHKRQQREERKQKNAGARNV